MDSFEHAYEMLKKVFYDKSYSSLRSDDEGDALAVKLFYGVLESNISLNFMISALTEKRPKRGLDIILKLGIYAMKNLSIPPYAVVDRLVKITKQMFSEREAGFINATLKKSQTAEIEMPRGKFEALSIRSDKPEWLVRALAKQYKDDDLNKVLFAKPCTKEHIRINTLKTSNSEIERLFLAKRVPFIKTDEGYFVQNCEAIKSLYGEGKITVQSYCSAKAAHCVTTLKPHSVLDMCSAPGGKAVYIAERLTGCKVIAWDNKTHRVRLIESYKKRMGINNIAAAQKDASVFDEMFENSFDVVLADVPCSGFGVATKKPDVYLNRTFDDILKLSELQYKILQNAFRYAKKGGTVIYSTCTILREENYNVIGRFLKETPNAKLLIGGAEPLPKEGFYQYLPDSNGIDGFFIAALRKE